MLEKDWPNANVCRTYHTDGVYLLFHKKFEVRLD